MSYLALEASNGTGEAVLATVQSPGRSIGSTAIPVNAITNWPTGTFIGITGTLTANNTLTNAQVFYGTATGTTVTITSFAPGYSDLGNSAGDVVVIKPTTEWANLVARFINNATNNGTPEALTVSGLTATGGTTDIDSTLYKSCKFSVYRNAPYSFTTASPLIFDTKLFDTSNNYSVSTGLFTAPQSGFYWFKASVWVNGAMTGFLTLYKNTTTPIFNLGPSDTSSAENKTWSDSDLVQLNAGDTVGLYSGAAFTLGTGPTTKFSGFFVSNS